MAKPSRAYFHCTAYIQPMKRTPGANLIVIGLLLEAINIFSLATHSFDTSKGTPNLIGQILFNAALVVGIILIVKGIKRGMIRRRLRLGRSELGRFAIPVLKQLRGSQRLLVPAVGRCV